MMDSNGGVGAVRVFVTNNDTHPADKWASEIVEQLVPIYPGTTHEGIVRVYAARQTLKQPIIEAIDAIIKHERIMLDKSQLDGMFRTTENWLDQYVGQICKVVQGLDGDKVSLDQMKDSIFIVLRKWFNSVQQVERDHYMDKLITK